jgi:hypothetical protein
VGLFAALLKNKDITPEDMAQIAALVQEKM